MNKNILIHNNKPDSNKVRLDLFDRNNRIKFEDTDNIDKYISTDIIPRLKQKDFDVIFIKDNLSENYIELLGLRVAYHIRLSSELEDKKYFPIVIISDVDSYILNKLDPLGKILFTKNIFIIPNTKEKIEKLKNWQLLNLSEKEYQNDFLNLITVEPPKDYTDHHSITNEWAIHQWSDTLNISSNAIQTNHDKMDSMLYFKYLKALHADDEDMDEYKITQSQKRGKILYIDDEWNKGWSDILTSLFNPSSGIEFETFEYEYRDVQKFRMMQDIKEAVENEDPDVVILDLRLSQTDHDHKEDIDAFTGIKILKMIHEINPGIQVIMMTATRQSVILEKLYDYGVLGYIKKEHPNDMSIKTADNINKLFILAEEGLERKYLKRIWSIQNELTALNMILNAEKERDDLNTHIKGKSINLYELQENKLSEESEKLLELKSTIPMIYEILDSNIKNKFSYTVLNIFKCLEIIADYYIKEESKIENGRRIRYAIWKHNNERISQNGNCSVNNKLSNIINRLFKDVDINLNKNKNIIVCTRNAIIHPDTIIPSCEDRVIAEGNLNQENIKNWLEMLCSILKRMDKQSSH